MKAKSNAEGALKTRFGANVRAFRQRLGYSQEELAWRADMHRTYVADIERGSRNISLFSIVRLVRALGISLARFFQKLENGAAAPGAGTPRRRPRIVKGGRSGLKQMRRRSSRRRE